MSERLTIKSYNKCSRCKKNESCEIVTDIHSVIEGVICYYKSDPPRNGTDQLLLMQLKALVKIIEQRKAKTKVIVEQEIVQISLF